MDTCRSVNLATRAAILATELFCKMNRHIDAANLFIRLTGDDSDVRSALFLEQASKCFMKVSPNLTRNSNFSHSSSNQLISRSSSTQSLLSVIASSEAVGGFGSRYRKAAFHYILAGHRYNKCGLKHFALICYRRFNYPHWEAASDHVNLTVAKLYLTIAGGNLKKFENYFLCGLKILQSCSHKQIFFHEFTRELKKHHSTSLESSDQQQQIQLDAHIYMLKVPSIHSYLFVSFDSLQPQEFSYNSNNQRHICFVGEQIEIQFTMSNSFPFKISNLQLICDQSEFVYLEFEPDIVQFETSDKVIDLTLRLTPKQEADFAVVGIKYTFDEVQFQRMFSERMQQSLNFKAVRTLPLIPIEIAIPQLGLDYTAVNQSKHVQNSVLMIPGKVYGSELITLKVVAQSKLLQSIWTPTSLEMYSSAKQYYSWPMNSIDISDASQESEQNNKNELQIPIKYGYGPMDLQIHIPPKCDRHLVTIRLVYSDDKSKQKRIVFRKLSFEVQPCIDLETKYGSVILLRNLSPSYPVAIWDCTIGDDELVAGLSEGSPDSTFVTIPVDHSCYLLALKTFVRWTLPTTTNCDSKLTTDLLPRNGMIVFS